MEKNFTCYPRILLRDSILPCALLSSAIFQGRAINPKTKNLGLETQPQNFLGLALKKFQP